MEKKEISTVTTISSVSGATKFLGMSGAEMVQMPYTAIPNATAEMSGFMSKQYKDFISRLNIKISSDQTPIDANTYKKDTVIAGHTWLNTPESVIGCLEVIAYSNDWILQRFTKISANTTVWVRSYHGGTTWGKWFRMLAQEA